jgi:hypothetical protein
MSETETIVMTGENDDWDDSDGVDRFDLPCTGDAVE